MSNRADRELSHQSGADTYADGVPIPITQDDTARRSATVNRVLGELEQAGAVLVGRGPKPHDDDLPGGRVACRLFGVDRGRHDVVELLRQTQLFADLPDAALEELAAAAVLRRWPLGASVDDGGASVDDGGASVDDGGASVDDGGVRRGH